MSPKQKNILGWGVVVVVFVGGQLFSARRSEAKDDEERLASVTAALRSQGCEEVPLIGGHLPALSRSEGEHKQDKRYWYTYEVAACGQCWHVELAGAAATRFSKIEKFSAR